MLLINNKNITTDVFIIRKLIVHGILRIHQMLFNVEISFASNSFIIKVNITKESLLNLPFNYPYFNLSEKSFKKVIITLM